MKLISSDLNNGGIANLLAALENDMSDCEKLSGALSTFIGVINTKESLDGASYQAVKTKLEEYKNLLDSRKAVAHIVSDAVNSSVNKMKVYINPYNELDDSELDTLRQNASNANTEIDRILTEGKDEEGILSRDAQSRIASLRSQLDYLNKQIEKIEQLAPTDASAYGRLENSEFAIAAYKSRISGINPIQVNIKTTV